MAQWTSGNRINTLVDGVDIFPALKTDLLAADQSGFIYAAFWQFSPDLIIDVNRPHETLGHILRQKALRGVPIRLLIWDFFTRLLGMGVASLAPRSILATVDLEPLIVPFVGQTLYQLLAQPTVSETERWVQHVNDEIRQSRQGTRIELCVARFPDHGMPPGRSELGPIALGSHHQKIVIINRPGDDDTRRLVAYVLGTNASNEYQDDHSHQRYYPPHPRRSIREKPWHDAGAKMEGPAAAQVEGEFVRRWNLNSRSRMSSCDLNAPVRQGARARLLITSSQHDEMRTELATRLRNALQLVYAEDQYFCNVELIDKLIEAYLASELCHQRETQSPVLQLALLTTGPTEFRFRGGTDHPMEVYRYLNFKNLQLCTCHSVSIRGRSHPIRRGPGEDWRLQPRSGAGRWLLNNLYIQRSQRERIWLRNIVDIRGGMRPAYIWSRDAGRAVYVHSKITVIDDRFLFVGSTNYSTRSMEYDSEASVQIENEDIARDLRLRLFGEMLGPPPRGIPYDTPQAQFRFWHNVAQNNARIPSRRCQPAERNVCLVEYPDRRPNLAQLARDLGSLLGAGVGVLPPFGPILGPTPLGRLLRDLHGRQAQAALAALLEEIYRLH